MKLEIVPGQLLNGCVDPGVVPQRILYTGARMPAIGLGTFGSDHVTATEIAAAVEGAAAVGYRHFDCASVYGNEQQIGFALQEVLRSGVKREHLWITSKLWNDRHGEKDVLPSCKQSLTDLRLDYLDLYLVHWPFPNFHPPGCDVTSRSRDARPYIHAEFMKTWRKLEELLDLGLVRHIGTSNMTIPKLRLLLRDARIKPAVNQMELHPHFQQPELFDFVRSNGIVPVGYSPIGSPARPERDRTPEDTSPTQDPVIVRIANRIGLHPAIVCIKWAVQRGQVPIPFSTKRNQYLSNLEAVASEPLTENEMREISAIDRNCRLIKGQVFLWREGQSWQDLWDLDGEITPA
ncbi:MAG TPA: aldo/keto reductase [Terriglobales bacterium]|jgi:diketogulonate reductase-like aldo/keto reductase|nr:aldo/keto reductase [Terriglobales bacterium]